MSLGPRACPVPAVDPRTWGRVGLAWLHGFRDPRAWGYPRLSDLRAPQVNVGADNSTAQSWSRSPCPVVTCTHVQGPRSPGTLLAQRKGTARNIYYVNLAPVWACRAWVPGRSPSFSSAGPSRHVSSQPRRFSTETKIGPKPSGTSENAGSTPKAAPRPQADHAGASQKQTLGAGWALSIPGRGAFSWCGRRVSGFRFTWQSSLSGVG